MRKNLILFHLGYYVLSMPIYAIFLLASTLIYIYTFGMGGAMYMSWYILLVATPITVAAITRFSLLKWPVDPIAAIEVPIVAYVGTIFATMLSWDITFYDSFLLHNKKLSANGGEGWLFLFMMFVVALAASFSIARKRRENISYRVLSKYLV